LRYLVTGATGFIGPFLVKSLTSSGHYCRCLVRSVSKANAVLEPGVELIEGDITNKVTLKGVASGIDGLFHLATLGHMHNFDTPQEMFHEVNVQGTMNIMNEALAAGVKKIVHCSSVAAMGICKDIPANEKSECIPHHPYGKSKLRAEQEVLQLVHDKNLPAVIIRFSMVYGPGDQRDILKLTRLTKKSLIPKIGKRPKLTPLIHVEDAVQGLLLAMDRGKVGEIYLITNAQSEPFDNIIKIIKEALGVSSMSIPVPEWAALNVASIIEYVCNFFGKKPIVTRKNIESTIADRIFSIEKAKKELGFEPLIDPEKGLRETVLWYMKNGWI
jgi:nucleoside-diphosphate-sugar epimerase